MGQGPSSVVQAMLSMLKALALISSTTRAPMMVNTDKHDCSSLQVEETSGLGS